MLEAYSDNIQYLSSKYMEIRREDLKMIYGDLQSNILGQEKCKKQIMSGLYRMSTKGNDKPIVLMLYGPSGVGKTETAKSISKSLGGELLRIQFSMMQSNEAYNYIFGAEHSKGSFARDMMGRESNVILIDEFDKVNPIFYNAFYELFDEGKYVDSNYEVNLNNAIFLCTCNFMSQNEIKKVLGPAMFSRIGCCIEYMDLTKEHAGGCPCPDPGADVYPRHRPGDHPAGERGCEDPGAGQRRHPHGGRRPDHDAGDRLRRRDDRPGGAGRPLAV